MGMALNTDTELRAFGQFETLETSALLRCLDMAAAEVEHLGSAVPQDAKKDLELWWAAHFAALFEGQTLSGSLENLSFGFEALGKPGLEETSYGREVKRRLQRLRGPKVRFRVL